MKHKFLQILVIIFLVGNLFFLLQPASAAEGDIYPVYGPRTINLGKQGVFLSNPPVNTNFIKIEKIKPPLRPRYTFGVDISYRGQILEITFLNSNFTEVRNPAATLSSVYFNISKPEVRMWEEGGPDAIAILYYNKRSEEWRMCPTRFVPEKLNNGKYDRLACLMMGNGFYVLGKMEVDKNFPLWFRLQGEELVRQNQMIQDY
jgi:hypothetical protein